MCRESVRWIFYLTVLCLLLSCDFNQALMTFRKHLVFLSSDWKTTNYSQEYSCTDWGYMHWLYIDASLQKCGNPIANFTNNTSHLFTNTLSTHPPPRHVYPLPRLVLSLLPVAVLDPSEQKGHPQCVLSLTLNCSHQAPSLPRRP